MKGDYSMRCILNLCLSPMLRGIIPLQALSTELRSDAEFALTIDAARRFSQLEISIGTAKYML